ncbi:hypothetical protein D8674_012161 [Pyrus ussuriensis x Pyrus communis]|uniref:RNase H type-1 domain-containing protein n=1 Tax=Pyrus ussuriensis x Pyrus communis TaxID=2448454 RepID=A0A5N5G0W0_9ROSA|nr:hypothetical protein D8674_012161 [Pyrus ussuriensis x Pyrus communis]
MGYLEFSECHTLVRQCVPLNAFVPYTISKWYNFLLVSSVPSVGIQLTLSSPAKWSKPGVGFFKLNKDEAWDANRLMGGVGAVLRNSNGKFMMELQGVFIISPKFFVLPRWTYPQLALSLKTLERGLLEFVLPISNVKLTRLHTVLLISIFPLPSPVCGLNNH